MAASCLLLSLPEELILHILDSIEDKPSLCTVARTCSRLQTLAEPFIYRAILIHTGEQACQLATALNARPSRNSSVRQLDIRLGKGDSAQTAALELRKLVKLKEFTVEKECCNDAVWGIHSSTWVSRELPGLPQLLRDAALPTQSAPLQHLVSLSLHSHGEGSAKFGLGAKQAVFFHPTLRHLTLQCVDLGPDLACSLPGSDTVRTPLTSLVFEECNISVQAFKAILALPRELESLTIGERLFHLGTPLLPGSHFITLSFPPLCSSPPELFAALQQQRHSLKYLKHVGLRMASHLQAGLPKDPDFYKLEALETLEIGLRSYLLCPFYSHISLPSLQHLRYCLPRRYHLFTSEHKDLDNQLSLYRYKRLQYFDIVLGHCYEDNILRHTWHQRLSRRNIFKVGSRMKEKGVRLKVFAIRGVNYIPPYLYGEEIPEEVLAYDFEQPKRFGNTIDDDVDIDVDEGDEEVNDVVFW